MFSVQVFSVQDSGFTGAGVPMIRVQVPLPIDHATNSKGSKTFF